MRIEYGHHFRQRNGNWNQSVVMLRWQAVIANLSSSLRVIYSFSGISSPKEQPILSGVFCGNAVVT
ncbi:MAG: hypothetical protein WC782_07175 [Methylococcaceae bacterium]